MLSKSHFSEGVVYVSHSGHNNRSIWYYISPRKRREDEFIVFGFVKKTTWTFKPLSIKKEFIIKKYPEVSTDRKDWDFDYMIKKINEYISEHPELRYDMIKSTFND